MEYVVFAYIYIYIYIQDLPFASNWIIYWFKHSAAFFVMNAFVIRNWQMHGTVSSYRNQEYVCKLLWKVHQTYRRPVFGWLRCRSEYWQLFGLSWLWMRWVNTHIIFIWVNCYNFHTKKFTFVLSYITEWKPNKISMYYQSLCVQQICFLSS